MSTHYSSLGLPPGATLPEIKDAYRELSRRHHPDAGGDHDTFCAVTQAASVLLDPSRRQAYDLELALLRLPCTVCLGTGQQWRQASFTTRVATPCAACKGEGFGPARVKQRPAVLPAPALAKVRKRGK